MNILSLVKAAQKFVHRVDNGEVRSVTSYNEFKQALEAPDSPIDMVLFCPACGTQHIDAPDMQPCVAGCMMAKDYGLAAMEGHHCSEGCMYMREGSPRWTNPPHKTHECQNPRCGHKWRPCATHFTNGVEDVELGSSDSRPPMRQRNSRILPR